MTFIFYTVTSYTPSVFYLTITDHFYCVGSTKEHLIMPTEHDNQIQVEIHEDGNMDNRTISTDESATFLFEEWTKKVGLNRKTTSAMTAEDLNNEQALQFVTESDIISLPITLGQKRLLLVAVENLQSANQNRSDQPVSQEPKPTQAETIDGQSGGLAVNFEQVQRSDRTTVADLRRQQENLFSAGKELDELLATNNNDNGNKEKSVIFTSSEKDISDSAHFMQSALSNFNGTSHVDPRTVLTYNTSIKKPKQSILHSLLSKRPKDVVSQDEETWCFPLKMIIQISLLSLSEPHYGNVTLR